MNDLISKIRQAQVEAGENAVIESLRARGLLDEPIKRADTIESLRAELSKSELDSEARRESIEHLLAENETLQRELGASLSLIESLEMELASERAANAKLRKALMGELSNASVWEGYYWLEKNTTVKAGLATISGLYKILRKAELRALGEAVPVQQDLTDGECYKTYAEKISGDPDADDDEHLLGLRAVIAADRKRNL